MPEADQQSTAKQPTPALLEAARRYHALGWQIIPIRPIDHNIWHPWYFVNISKMIASPWDYVFYRRYNRNPEALTRKIRQRRSNAIGVLTGKPSGLLVIDVDVRTGGLASLVALQLPPTRTVITPGGKHLYYRCPPGAHIVIHINWRPGIDLLGEYTFSTVPPSLSAHGMTYRWEDETIPIADFPTVYLQELSSLRKSRPLLRFLGFRDTYARIPYHRWMQWRQGGVENMWTAESTRNGIYAHKPILLAAEAYQRRGWAIIPIRAPMRWLRSWLLLTSGKLPSRARDFLLWPRYNQSWDTLRRHIVRRNARGIGIITGMPSGLVVLDIDDTYGGSHTLASLQLPETLTARTPRGLHLFFRYNDAYPIGTLNNAWPGIDIRGNDGYVIVPPSCNAHGVPYTWENSDTAVAELPSAIAQQLAYMPSRSRWRAYAHYLRRSTLDPIIHLALDKLFGIRPQ